MAFTLPIGAPAPDFDLPATDGRNYSLADFQDAPVLVVAFTCNHCPYVIQSEQRVLDFTRDYKGKLAYVAINSNSENTYADDDFEGMKQRARERGFEFPYLRDQSQDIARAYGALRTPHFFVFDADRKLRLHGPHGRQPAQSRQRNHARTARTPWTRYWRAAKWKYRSPIPSVAT